MIQSIDRAIRVLTALQGQRRMSLSEIAARLELAPSTTHGIVRSLVEHGMVVQERGSSRYQLGPAVLRLGNVYLDTLELRSKAIPWAEDLARRTGLAVRIGVLLIDDVVIIHHEPRPDGSRQMPEVGIVIPAHASALGKAMLAFLPDEEKRVLTAESLRSMTGETITAPDALRNQLDEVRVGGLAVEAGRGGARRELPGWPGVRLVRRVGRRDRRRDPVQRRRLPARGARRRPRSGAGRVPRARLALVAAAAHAPRRCRWLNRGLAGASRAPAGSRARRSRTCASPRTSRSWRSAPGSRRRPTPSPPRRGSSARTPTTRGCSRTPTSTSSTSARHTGSHFPMAVAAMKAGKHVLCEKPIGVDATQARQLADLAETARRLPHGSHVDEVQPDDPRAPDDDRGGRHWRGPLDPGGVRLPGPPTTRPAGSGSPSRAAARFSTSASTRSRWPSCSMGVPDHDLGRRRRQAGRRRRPRHGHARRQRRHLTAGHLDRARVTPSATVAGTRASSSSTSASGWRTP